jgi:hypothetical protein
MPYSLLKRWSLFSIALCGVLNALAPAAQAQDKVIDDFEHGLNPEWVTLKVTAEKGLELENESRLAVTQDAQQVKSGQGTLSYFYQVAPKAVRGLSLPRDMDLTGMKSVHFWAKCNTSTAMLFALDQKSGSNYQAGFYCPAGQWQEVTLNLDELLVDDVTKDIAGGLQLNQVKGIHFGDLATLFANFVTGLEGQRVLWLDDISFSPRPATFTTGYQRGSNSANYVVDNFASPVIRWAPLTINIHGGLSLFDAPLQIEPADGGKAAALRYSYKREQNQLHAVLRNLDKVNMGIPTQLNLRLNTTVDGTFMVILEENGGARYEQMVQLHAADNWKSLVLPLGGFTLAGDSKDDNGKLDTDKIKTLSVVDISALLPTENGNAIAQENTLRLSDVRFDIPKR